MTNTAQLHRIAATLRTQAAITDRTGTRTVLTDLADEIATLTLAPAVDDFLAWLTHLDNPTAKRERATITLADIIERARHVQRVTNLATSRADDAYRLSRIAYLHSRDDGPNGLTGAYCNECEHRYPCDTRQLADYTHPAEGDCDNPTSCLLCTY